MRDVRQKCNFCSVRFSNKWDENDHYSRKHNNHNFDKYHSKPYMSEQWEMEFPPLGRPKAHGYYSGGYQHHRSYLGNGRRVGLPAQC